MTNNRLLLVKWFGYSLNNDKNAYVAPLSCDFTHY